MFNHPYICLKSTDELNDDSLREWYKSVRDFGPNGIVASTELDSDDHQQYRFYRKLFANVNHYIVVLSRNLLNDEATAIANMFNGVVPDGDFEISWSQELTPDDSHIKLTQDATDAIALEAAKLNHNTWLREKMATGWRFGQSYSPKAKVSPMCTDWENLSETYKKVELQRMMSLLNVLSSMNLKLVFQN